MFINALVYFHDLLNTEGECNSISVSLFRYLQSLRSYFWGSVTLVLYEVTGSEIEAELL